MYKGFTLMIPPTKPERMVSTSFVDFGSSFLLMFHCHLTITCWIWTPTYDTRWMIKYKRDLLSQSYSVHSSEKHLTVAMVYMNDIQHWFLLIWIWVFSCCWITVFWSTDFLLWSLISFLLNCSIWFLIDRISHLRRSGGGFWTRLITRGFSWIRHFSRYWWGRGFTWACFERSVRPYRLGRIRFIRIFVGLLWGVRSLGQWWLSD